MKINNTSVGLIFSIIIIISGILYGLYSFIIYPTLIPHYGGGERFYLSKENNYTATYDWYSQGGLTLIIESNDTSEIFLNNTLVCNCSYYNVFVKENTHLRVKIQSNHSLEGFIRARRKVPVSNIILSYSIPLLGTLIFFIIIYLRQKRVNEEFNAFPSS
jgi:hypothetical protein